MSKRIKAGRLSFGKGNAKLGKEVATFSLPAGHCCIGAKDCKAWADRATGKVTDGPHCQFRCYAASDEARRTNVRVSRWRNLEMLRAAGDEKGMADLILRSLPSKAQWVRLHVSGDFFSQAYFDAWCAVARRKPSATFYCYTKSLPLWARRLGSIPTNLVLTASRGGKYDSLIAKHALRSVRVVYSEAEAKALGLEIDHDDSHAMKADCDFAILIHGPQPKASRAARAISTLRAQGEFGYGERANARRAARVPLAMVG